MFKRLGGLFIFNSPFPVFGGRNEIHGFEAFGEIARRTEPYLIGDFGNLHVGTVLEQMGCLAKPAVHQMLVGGDAAQRLKLGIEGAPADAHLLRQLVDAELFFGEVEGYDGIYLIQEFLVLGVGS